jgi:hypothetical protein
MTIDERLENIERAIIAIEEQIDHLGQSIEIALDALKDDECCG